MSDERELTDGEQREITERLKRWHGSHHRVPREQWGLNQPKPGPHPDFDPFTSLDDAHLLLVECLERGLMPLVAVALRKRWTHLAWCKSSEFEDANVVEAIAMALLATAKQITLAVDEVIRNLPERESS